VAVALGVCALVGLLLIAAAPFSSSPKPQLGPPPQPFLPAEPPALVNLSPSSDLQSTPAGPSGAGAPTGTGGAGPADEEPANVRPTEAEPTASTPRPSPARTTPTPPGPVTGRYRVVDSFEDGFIGEVRVSNASDRENDWVVRLRFPANVGELKASWVESAPQATLSRSGSWYVWSSEVPLSAHGQALLRFHYARSGPGDVPAACTVNGAACSGL
jgi:hypothetical protein